jgi:hypothetical protein
MWEGKRGELCVYSICASLKTKLYMNNTLLIYLQTKFLKWFKIPLNTVPRYTFLTQVTVAKWVGTDDPPVDLYWTLPLIGLLLKGRVKGAGVLSTTLQRGAGIFLMTRSGTFYGVNQWHQISHCAGESKHHHLVKFARSRSGGGRSEGPRRHDRG